MNFSTGSEVPSYTRLAARAGYEDLPTVRDTLPFVLPPFQLRSTRYVRFEKVAFELWSPNSTRKPFYPGLIDSSNTSVNENGYSNALLRRTDGHLGRFNPTVSPQNYDFQKPWSPFVRRVASPQEYPEFALFLDYWDYGNSKLQQGLLGRLYARVRSLHEIVASYELESAALGIHWDHRPRGPTITDLAKLAQLSAVEEAVDRHCRICSGMKQLSAWCKFARQYIDHPPSDDMATAPVVPATENWMGLWINGCPAQEAYWYLRAGVPCFVIHQIDSLRERHYLGSAPYASFWKDCELRDREPLMDQMDAWYSDRSWMIVSTLEDQWKGRSEPSSLWTERQGSSPRNQGWLRNTWSKSAPLVAPFQELNGWIIPPPIQTEPQAAGQWRHFMETTDRSGDVVMKLVNINDVDEEAELYYDRRLRRILYFESRDVPPRHYRANELTFGRPAPDIRYVQGSDDKRKILPPSTWMYRTRVQKKGDGGLKYDSSVPEHNAMPAETARKSSSAAPPRRDYYDSDSLSDRDETSAHDGEDIVMEDHSRSSISPQEGDRPVESRLESNESTRSPGRRDVPQGRHDYLPEVPHFSTAFSSLMVDRRSRSRPNPGWQRTDTWRPGDPYDRSPPRSASSRQLSTSSHRLSRRDSRHREDRNDRSRSPSRTRNHSRQRTPQRPRSQSRSPARSHSSQTQSRTSSPATRAASEAPVPELPLVETNRTGQMTLPRPQILEPVFMAVSSFNRRLPVLAGEGSRTDIVQVSNPRGIVPPVPVSYVVGMETRFVIIWNLPPNYYWTEVLTFVRSMFPNRKNRPVFIKILRTVIDGQQIFWFQGETQGAVNDLRSALTGCNAVGSSYFEVDYVTPDTWSTACANFMDAWTPRTGMALDQPGARPTLLDRLDVPPGRAAGPYPSARFFLEDPSPSELNNRPSLPIPTNQPSLAERLSNARTLLSRLSDASPSTSSTPAVPLSERITDASPSTSSTPAVPLSERLTDATTSESNLPRSKRARRRLNKQLRDQQDKSKDKSKDQS